MEKVMNILLPSEPSELIKIARQCLTDGAYNEAMLIIGVALNLLADTQDLYSISQALELRLKVSDALLVLSSDSILVLLMIRDVQHGLTITNNGPQRAKFFFYLGKLNMLVSEYGEAARAFTQAMFLAGGPGAVSYDMANYCTHLAEAKMKQGDTVRASYHLKGALKHLWRVHPEFIDGWVLLLKVYTNLVNVTWQQKRKWSALNFFLEGRDIARLLRNKYGLDNEMQQFYDLIFPQWLLRIVIG